MDLVNAWVTIKATQRELDEVEEVFTTIMDFQASRDVQLTSRQETLATLFHSKSRPAVYAWLSSAPQALRRKLENFEAAVHQTGLEQIYATTPASIRRRLIAASISMPIQLDQGPPVDGEDDLEMENEDHGGGDEWMRTTLGESETKERLETEKATRRLQQAGSNCIHSVESYAVHVAGGLLILFFAMLSVVIWRGKAGCCATTVSDWQLAGIKEDSCSEQNRERGKSCTASCQDGFYHKDFVSMIFTCDRKSVEWRPLDQTHSPRCEVDGCLYHKCQKQSHCKQEPGGNYSCSCLENGVGGLTDRFCQHCKNGYGGEGCGKKVCESSPCLNGGECSGGDDNFTCTCKNGFAGAECRTDICSSLPCLHGGTCLHDGNEYTCKCPDGYAGSHCATQDFCASSPCLHRGECHDVSTEERYECLCTSGWGGLNCASNFCENSPCAALDPAGMECVGVVGGYNCSCPAGFITTDPGPHPICDNPHETLLVSGIGVQTVSGKGEGLDGRYDMQPTMCSGRHWWGKRGATVSCPSPDKKLPCCARPVCNCGVGRTQEGGDIGYCFSAGCYSCQGRGGCSSNPAATACDPNAACSSGTGKGSTAPGRSSLAFLPSVVSGSPTGAWVLYNPTGQAFVWGNAVDASDLPATLGWTDGGETGGTPVNLAWASNGEGQDVD